MNKLIRGTGVFLLTCAALPFLGCGHTKWPSHMQNAHEFLGKGLEHRKLVRVKPWERELLSRSDMGWESDKLESTRRNHIHFSKEASLIGGSAGGGGCGCN